MSLNESVKLPLKVIHRSTFLAWAPTLLLQRKWVEKLQMEAMDVFPELTRLQTKGRSPFAILFSKEIANGPNATLTITHNKNWLQSPARNVSKQDLARGVINAFTSTHETTKLKLNIYIIYITTNNNDSDNDNDNDQ